ncbi:MAG: hypothetical protein N2Z65_03985 [Clostridiales bacterium]|nr:hypothetical protein [Clostridiales bacterium]
MDNTLIERLAVLYLEHQEMENVTAEELAEKYINAKKEIIDAISQTNIESFQN